MYNSYSVLMSVYYKEKAEYLRESMQSIYDQTVPTNDFVLVCDGPLNEELDVVIDKMQEKFGERLNVLRLKENYGLGIALNIGMKYCKNELVARMDSDDISRPDRCHKQLLLFKENTSLSFASGTISEFLDKPEYLMGYRVLPLDNEHIRKFSKKRNPMNHPCVMLKKSDVIAAGGYQEKYHLFEDYYLWIRMLQKGYKAQNLSDILLDMRISTDLYMRRGGKRYADNMLQFHKWMYRSGWISAGEYFFCAVPHAIICILPSKIRRIVYRILHKKKGIWQ